MNSLEVQEDGQTLLEQKHMKVNMEFKELVFNCSQILFTIKEMPIHGFLQLDVSSEEERAKAFTMLDLQQGKVWYVHDGSEEPMDYFTFLITSKNQKEMPFYLQDHDPYVFNINVIPVNDPPYLKLPEGNMLLCLRT